MIQTDMPTKRSLPTGSRSLTLSALAGVVGPLLFVLVFTIDGFLRPGYSAIREPASDLGRGPNAWIFNTTLLIFGLLLIIFAIGFGQWLRSLIGGRRATICLVLLILSGVGAVTGGLFAEYVPGEPTTSLSGLMHGLGFLTLFGTLMIALLIIGWSLRKDPQWGSYGWYSLITALVAFLLNIVPVFIPGHEQIGGLLQRVMEIEAFAWYVVTGCRLLLLRNTSQKG